MIAKLTRIALCLAVAVGFMSVSSFANASTVVNTPAIQKPAKTDQLLAKKKKKGKKKADAPAAPAEPAPAK